MIGLSAPAPPRLRFPASILPASSSFGASDRCFVCRRSLPMLFSSVRLPLPPASSVWLIRYSDLLFSARANMFRIGGVSPLGLEERGSRSSGSAIDASWRCGPALDALCDVIELVFTGVSRFQLYCSCFFASDALAQTVLIIVSA